jgi:hypothetical protein
MILSDDLYHCRGISTARMTGCSMEEFIQQNEESGRSQKMLYLAIDYSVRLMNPSLPRLETPLSRGEQRVNRCICISKPPPLSSSGKIA